VTGTSGSVVGCGTVLQARKSRIRSAMRSFDLSVVLTLPPHPEGALTSWLHGLTALPPGKEHRYPLDRRLGEPQSRSGRLGEEKILDPTSTQTPTPRSSNP
jgi:hypothetical protein